MNLDDLSNDINQTEKEKEVTNADMLASLVIIQGELRKIEKIITENQKNDKKAFEVINKTLEHYDKNISAIPVLTANITTEKVNDLAANINNSTDNIALATKALNESNNAFRTFLQAWVGSMVICIIVVIGLIIWWR